LLERSGFCLLRQLVRFGAQQSIYLAEPAFVKAATYPSVKGTLASQGSSMTASCPYPKAQHGT
jgi:hypothetical protein